MFRVIIAGGRSFNNYPLLRRKLNSLLRNKTEVTIVSGTAKGADLLGERYAIEKGFNIARYPADWSNLSTPGAIKKRRQDGVFYNAVAGHDRNAKMADNADALVAFWDGESTGTKNMIDLATEKGLLVRTIKY